MINYFHCVYDIRRNYVTKILIRRTGQYLSSFATISSKLHRTDDFFFAKKRSRNNFFDHLPLLISFSGNVINARYDEFLEFDRSNFSPSELNWRTDDNSDISRISKISNHFSSYIHNFKHKGAIFGKYAIFFLIIY